MALMDEGSLPEGAMAAAFIDLGITSAAAFHCQVAEPNHNEFRRRPSTISALNAAWAYWHLYEWDFWDQHPSTLTGKQARPLLEKHGEQVIDECPELAVLRDMTDASKHRGLHRGNVKVTSVSPHVTGPVDTGVIFPRSWSAPLWPDRTCAGIPPMIGGPL
jgi:hypothetical protein